MSARDLAATVEKALRDPSRAPQDALAALAALEKQAADAQTESAGRLAAYEATRARAVRAEEALRVVRHYLQWEKAIHGGASTEDLHRALLAENRPRPTLDEALAAAGADTETDG